MIKLHCTKTLENLIKFENIISKDEKYSDLNTWSANAFKIGNENSVIFINHKNMSCFVINNLSKKDFSQLDKFFISGLILELKKICTLDLIQENKIRSNYQKINYFSKAENKTVNYLLRNYTTIFRNISQLDPEDRKDWKFDQYIDSIVDSDIIDDIDLLFIK